jgi:hypothetical protein
MNQPEEISYIELKRLLHDLKDKRPDIGIRLRLLGAMWARNFSTIQVIGDSEVVVFNEAEKQKYVHRFQDIMQFEIDSPFQIYRPFSHYRIRSLKEEKFA